MQSSPDFENLFYDLFRKETSDDSIAFARTAIGKLILLLLFSIPLYLIMCSFPKINPPQALPVVVTALGLCMFRPEWRWPVLCIGTLGKFAIDPVWFYPTITSDLLAQESIVLSDVPRYFLGLTAGLAYFFSAAGTLYLRGRYPRWRVFKRPLLSLLGVTVALFVVADSGVFSGVARAWIWLFALMNATYIWFLGYALIDKSPESMVRPLTLFNPIWCQRHMPFGKNVSYLRKTEAKNEQEHAMAMISAVKLIFHCGMYLLLFAALTLALERASIPPYARAFTENAQGRPYPIWVNWVSLVGAFFQTVFQTIATLNAFVATARMAGFQLLRNSYRPFSARTIAEFWNRYMYYFKELLVDFFFYPTFLRHFKAYPRARLMFATFMAAGVGNLIYHMLSMAFIIPLKGFTAFINQSQTYAFYTLLLSTGISVSQLRNAPKGELSASQRVWSLFCVIAFFCLVHIFDDIDFVHGLEDSFSFLFNLFGMRADIHG